MLPSITFSTLACPAWSVPTVIANARAFGYDGIEWRGGDAGHINPKVGAEERTELRTRMGEANLFSVAITGYTRFVSPDAHERAENVEMLKRYLDLAADIDAKYVRVFLGELSGHQTLAEVYPRIVDSLAQCVEHAKGAGVGMAIEHHDSFVQTSSIVPILSRLDADAVYAVWDIANAYSAGENDAEGAGNLHGRIGYVQVKDGVGQHDRWRLTDVGAGDVPLGDAFQRLREQDYQGAFSVEWEHAWHPELEPPERALPHALHVVRELLDASYGTAGVRA